MTKPSYNVASYTLQFVLTFGAYCAAAWWSLDLFAVHTFAAPIWPASGIAIVAVYFGGMRLVPAIALAAFTVNYLLGAPLLGALGTSIGNILEVVVAIRTLAVLGFSPLFRRLHDAVTFMVAASTAPFLSALIGPTTLVLAGALSASNLPDTMLTWWFGDLLGTIVIAPFLLRWFTRSIRHSRRTSSQVIENISFFVLLIVSSVLVFWDPIPLLKGNIPPYLIFVPLTWGALRVGPRMMTLAIVTVAGIAIAGTLQGFGPFDATASTLLSLQVFISAVSIISLLFVSTVEERKEAAHTLQQSVATLEHNVHEISSADQAKNDFIATLSHELRNPLAPVLSALEIMRLRLPAQGDTSDGAMRDLIQTAHENVQRMARLLDDLLDVARISRKKFKLEIATVCLRSILERSAQMASNIIQKHGHTLALSLPPTAVTFEADPLRIEQVIVNLLNNAAKYTPYGGSIYLSGAAVPSGVEIRVRDTGVGIPREMLSHIFEPFRQIEQSAQTPAVGLGIGLSLAKRLVEIHGGSIEARSEGSGRGSEFIIFLPTNPPQGETESVQKASPPTKQSRSVLIIDDDTIAADSLAKLLNSSGHVARIAHDTASALVAFSEFRPEIVLVDIKLSGESGYDIAQTIRETITPVPRIIALSGIGQDDERERALVSGFDLYLTKPVAIVDLERVLSKVA